MSVILISNLPTVGCVQEVWISNERCGCEINFSYLKVLSQDTNDTDLSLV